MNRRKALLAGALLALGICTAHAAGGPGFRFADHGKPQATAEIGSLASVKIFHGVAGDGIRLHNVTASSITVQDTVNLDTVTLAPGMRIGIACSSVRHLALSVGRDVTYESVRCGSELRFSSQGGQQ